MYTYKLVLQVHVVNQELIIIHCTFFRGACSVGVGEDKRGRGGMDGGEIYEICTN